jgi:hypothetical protein
MGALAVVCPHHACSRGLVLTGKSVLGPSFPALIGKMEPFVMLKLGDREYRTRACKGAWVHTDTARGGGSVHLVLVGS